MPNYFFITKGRLAMLTPTPSTTIIGAGVGPFMPRGGGNNLTVKADAFFTFNPITKLFEELHINYQGMKTEKLHTLQEFQY